MMDCAGFENGLVDLLDDGLTAGERQTRARGLRTHAEEWEIDPDSFGDRLGILFANLRHRIVAPFGLE